MTDGATVRQGRTSAEGTIGSVTGLASHCTVGTNGAAWTLRTDDAGKTAETQTGLFSAVVDDAPEALRARCAKKVNHEGRNNFDS